MARAVATWDSVKATELFAVFARNTTWQTPTLTGIRDVQRIQADIPGERLRWLPPRLIGRDSAGRRVEGSDRPVNARQYLLLQRIIPMMARAGVPILAGTDAPGTRRVPGPSLVEELEALVAAGLTPLQALRSATLNPARFLGLGDSLGTVAPGKVADLVLLDANPLADIAALRRVRAVIAGGRYYSQRDLERRRTEVQALLGRLRATAAPIVAGGGSAAPRQ
jgi:imidazolonepropionase-like amidohydrolase